MTITAGQLVAQAEHEIGGPVAIELGGGMALVNWSGRYLYNMCRWTSALRVSTGIDYVAGQSYVDLPDDYDELEYIREGELAFEVVQPAELERMRAFGTAFRKGALVNDGDVYRLELVRTPDANEADALTIVYRRKWVDVADNEDVIDVPDWLEMLLRLVVSKYARGLESGDLSAQLAEVEASPLYANALRRDARGAGTTFGYVPGTGGADVQSVNPYDWIRDGSVIMGP